jgi:ketosteroid isomerase-like protein
MSGLKKLSLVLSQPDAEGNSASTKGLSANNTWLRNSRGFGLKHALATVRATTGDKILPQTRSNGTSEGCAAAMNIRFHRARDAVASPVASRSPVTCALSTAHATALASRFLVAGFCTVAFAALAQSPDTSAAREIARVDSEYSKLSLAKGMPAASVENFAEHGVAFAPGAVNGKKYWASRTEFRGTLIWQPIFAFAAAAADLGFTTGPWELKKGNDEPSLGYGHYVTIWSKQRDGKWRIALDVGTENSEPRQPPPNLQVQPSDIPAAMRGPEDARRELETAEHKFTQLARDDIGKAILGSATDDIRIYRDKSFPAVGLVATRLMLESEHGRVTFQPGGSKMSESGDLYYSYGNYSEERGNVLEHGIYVMIWRANMNGDWKLALALQKKLPPSKTQ